MSKLEIKVGSFYKTRDGRKVRIYALDGAPNYPVQGAVLNPRNWVQLTWCLGGRYYDAATLRPEDIVSEWVEPSPEKPKLKAWISKSSFGCDIYFTRFSDNPPDDNFARAPWLDEPDDLNESN